jgi:hypothetical protein
MWQGASRHGTYNKQHFILRTIDTKEEARTSIYRGTLYMPNLFPSLALYSSSMQLICGYDATMTHM